MVLIEIVVGVRQASQRESIEAGHFALRHAFEPKLWGCDERSWLPERGFRFRVVAHDAFQASLRHGPSRRRSSGSGGASHRLEALRVDSVTPDG